MDKIDILVSSQGVFWWSRLDYVDSGLNSVEDQNEKKIWGIQFKMILDWQEWTVRQTHVKKTYGKSVKKAKH